MKCSADSGLPQVAFRRSGLPQERRPYVREIWHPPTQCLLVNKGLLNETAR